MLPIQLQVSSPIDPRLTSSSEILLQQPTSLLLLPSFLWTPQPNHSSGFWTWKKISQGHPLQISGSSYPILPLHEGGEISPQKLQKAPILTHFRQHPQYPVQVPFFFLFFFGDGFCFCKLFRCWKRIWIFGCFVSWGSGRRRFLSCRCRCRCRSWSERTHCCGARAMMVPFFLGQVHEWVVMLVN